MTRTRRYLIYTLRDPRSGGIRWVGQTASLAKRLASHMNTSPSDRSERGDWIRGLKSVGLQPIIELVETIDAVPGSSKNLALHAERALIAKLRKAGEPLLNLQGPGYSPPEKQVENDSDQCHWMPVGLYF